MESVDLSERLRGVAGRLEVLALSDTGAAGVVGFLCGAAYGLQRALELGFAHGEVDAGAYARELSAVAKAVSTGEAVTGVVGYRDGASHRAAWAAGFYLDSAVHRIAAAAERMGLVEKGERACDVAMPLGLVKHDTNAQKHDWGGVLSSGRWACRLEDAVGALEIVVQAVTARSPA